MLLLTIEFLFAAVIVYGVALIYAPAAMILGGTLGVLICERGAAVETIQAARAVRGDGKAEKVAQ